MKLLALGDLHGRFPKKLKEFVKKQKPDGIIYLGDFCDDDAIRKIIFREHTKRRWWEAVGLKKANKMLKECFLSGIRVMKGLDSLNIPIYYIFGNGDFYKFWGRAEKNRKGLPEYPGYFEDETKRLKNFIPLHRRITKLNGFNIAGYGGYVDATIFAKTDALKEKPNKHKKRNEQYMKIEGAVNSVFKKFKGKNLIFVTHWPPYNIKFDRIVNKESKMNGRHIGFEPFSQIDKKYKPLLHLCGHMHEHFGRIKMGKTTIVNPGYGREGKAAIIELNDGKPRIEKINFVRIN